jgi:hypothetical protein
VWSFPHAGAVALLAAGALALYGVRLRDDGAPHRRALRPNRLQYVGRTS